jgi:hypothetical protein
MKKIIIVIGVLFCALYGFTQSSGYQAQLHDLARIIKSHDSYSADLKIVMYSNERDSVIDIQTASIVRNKDRVRIKIDFIETYIDKKYKIVVDHTDKTITILPPDLSFISSMNSLDLYKIDTMVNFFNTVSGPTSTKYVLGISNREASRIEISVSKKDISVDTIFLAMKNNIINLSSVPDTYKSIPSPSLEFIYSNYVFGRTAKIKSTCSKNYFVKRRKTFLPQGEFADYIVVNKLSINPQY